ncbi:hypothetical protein EDD37DRAFT_13200 [Exophiala viscosa]|uniref:Zn(2)-C6 fungal-type domain-containing protein n=1 Tax=Exophiala viscosa TaxID=2486360 RepID=A0AAN6IAF8_9EURO|nr:hypothetical protein EDD36DRAFT_330774 [Exophiala viscosa]KAI1628581.1 hypothetical protein EDD37DRAFT_13200 [Exophiala viscosa]
MARHTSGCRNCVVRRVRCDERRPRCLNCEKRKIECNGPRQGALFVNKDTEDLCALEKSKPRKGSKESTEITIDRSSYYVLDVPVSPLTPIRRGFDWANKSSPDTHICHLRWQINERDKPWVGYCLEHHGEYPIADIAIEALAAAFYRNRYHHKTSGDIAAIKYGQALAALRLALESHGEGQDLFDILATTSALNRYELVIGTMNHNWIRHASGISRVIELAGPEHFRTYPNKLILESNRFRIIHEAYFHRRPTYLEKKEWSDLRSDLDPMSTMFVKLEDAFCVLTRVTSEISNFMKDDILDLDWDRHRDISARLQQLLANLDIWKETWITRFKFEATAKALKGERKAFYTDDNGLVFQSSLQYPNQRAALGLNMYRSLKVTALEWKYKLEHPDCQSPTTSKEDMGDMVEARILAGEICRSLHCHFDETDKWEVLAPFHLLFAAAVARRTFQPRSREAQWLCRLLNQVADRSGFEIARSIAKMHDHRWGDPDCRRGVRNVLDRDAPRRAPYMTD